MREVTHRIGIIGFGGFGRFLAKAWSGVEGVRLTAIADVNPDARQEGISQFADWRRLLDSVKVDVVSIVTPPATHPEIAAEALRRGVHVLVEKPIAVSVADAQQVLTAERDSPATATVDFMLRYNPIIECVHGWCREKTFGALQRIIVENYAQDESLTADHWFWDTDISGGILIEHAVHFIDIVNGCTSSPVARVDGRSWRRSDGRVDRMSVEAAYEDGLVAAQYHAFNRLEPFERTSIRFVFDGRPVRCGRLDSDGGARHCPARPGQSGRACRPPRLVRHLRAAAQRTSIRSSGRRGRAARGRPDRRSIVRPPGNERGSLSGCPSQVDDRFHPESRRSDAIDAGDAGRRIEEPGDCVCRNRCWTPRCKQHRSRESGIWHLGTPADPGGIDVGSNTSYQVTIAQKHTECDLYDIFLSLILVILLIDKLIAHSTRVVVNGDIWGCLRG